MTHVSGTAATRALAAIEAVQARTVDLLRHLPPPRSQRTHEEWLRLEADEAEAEYRAEVGRGEWMSEPEQKALDEARENRDLRAAESALEWMER